MLNFVHGKHTSELSSLRRQSKQLALFPGVWKLIAKVILIDFIACERGLFLTQYEFNN